ncbi:MAG: glycoside hydrolase family 78 protein [Saprospiraceae bacterium]|nr:glycoside hydrolase family 78 protein [Saprospiraceae bacterium]
MKILTKLFFLLVFSLQLHAQSRNLIDLTCEHLVNPLGISERTPRFSWKLESDKRNVKQVAYQIRVSKSPDFATKSIVWDSKKVNSDESVLVPYAGVYLASRQKYYWQVKVWDADTWEWAWSPVATFETGFFSPSEWEANWIELSNDTARFSPAVMFRKGFGLRKKVASARAYVTAHGFYELYLNGKKVSDDVLTPGWTSYNKRLQYQVYDVTNLLNEGKNAAGAIIGDGWYRGTLGWVSQWGIYGKRKGFLCQIHVKYADGSDEFIRTDASWKSYNDGPIRMTGIYDGETYDARKEVKNWTEASFNDTDWSPVQLGNYAMDNLTASVSVPVRKVEEIKPVRLFKTPKGTVVADMGQNMVGWVRLKVSGSAGKTITIRHAEVLDKYGEFYTLNLRASKSTAQYILRGDAEGETYEPRFTFFGFRYVAFDGLKLEELNKDNITGVVVHSDMPVSGTFECSNKDINQLQHNIVWGQKGNFVDVPTDCPQRDERLGWTGDAQAFCRTAAFNKNVAAFFTKWLQDVSADQGKNGEIPYVIPDVLNPNPAAPVGTSAGWGDVVTIAPWTLYQVYGDKRILEVNYKSMKAWVDYIHKKSGDALIWKGGSIFGDWLFYLPPPERASEPDGHTSREYISTAFFAYSCKLLAQSAEVLDKTEDAKFYNALFEKIKKVFIEEFVTKTGRTASDSQTSYVLALMFDLLPADLRAKATQYLVDDIKSRNNHLSTGFLGTPYLCHVLSDNGRTDVAYDLLFQDTYPSWLYPVKKGATTIWERWDGMKTDSSFQDIGMNSFNHYAYGAIGDWLYRVVAGIEIGKAGYKHILIQPQPIEKLTYAKASYESYYGKIESGWERTKEGKIILKVKIPANTTATIALKDTKPDKITEGGKSYSDKSTLQNIRTEGKFVKFEIGSGEYSFEY